MVGNFLLNFFIHTYYTILSTLDYNFDIEVMPY